MEGRGWDEAYNSLGWLEENIQEGLDGRSHPDAWEKALWLHRNKDQGEIAFW